MRRSDPPNESGAPRTRADADEGRSVAAFDESNAGWKPWVLEARVALAITGAFLVLGASVLEFVDYNFDEGVGIQQARLIHRGVQPFRDFFQHQIPAYVYTLALFSRPTPDSLFAYRALSLLATCGAGLALYGVARRALSPRGATFALLLFFTAPLQFYGLLALPHACVALFTGVGMRLLVFDRGALRAFAGSAALVVAVLYKPLVAPVAVVAAIAVIAAARIRDAAAAAAAVVVTAGGAWALFHGLSDGVFTEVLWLQASRVGGTTGFDQISGFGPFQAAMQARGVETAVEWNLSELALAFLQPAPRGNLHLLVLAALGAIAWLPAQRAWRGPRAVVVGWLVLPALFLVFVWAPAWDHYFVHYLPPLCLLAASGLEALWRSERARVAARVAVVAALAVSVHAGATHLAGRMADFSAAPRAAAGSRWLTFDPFANFVTRSEPACGIVDPFNVFGPNSLVALSALAGWDRFQVDPQDVLACLEADPDARIALAQGRTWFVDAPFAAALAELGAHRVVDLPISFRRSFTAIWRERLWN